MTYLVMLLLNFSFEMIGGGTRISIPFYVIGVAGERRPFPLLSPPSDHPMSSGFREPNSHLIF